jgi:hypothetical protein
VRVLSIARFLFALLAFQLAVGLQVGVAYATAATPMVSGMRMATHATGQATGAASAQVVSHDSAANIAVASSSTAGDDACPMHASSSHSAPLAKAPAGRHDCCKSSACQGHCGSVPLAFNVSPTRDPPASARVQPANTERAVVAPADTHFRPPILS